MFFILEYYLLNFSRQMISTNKEMLDDWASFVTFSSGLNMSLKHCYHITLSLN